MISLQVQGVRMATKNMDKWLNQAKVEAEKTARGLAAIKFAELLRGSPQYSGDFAANWNFSVNKVDKSFTEGAIPPRGDGELYQQGDMAAIGIANLNNAGKDASFKLGDTIYISNHAKHDGEMYSHRILRGTLPLRDANMNLTIQAAMQRYKDKYHTNLKGNLLGYIKGRRVGHVW